VDFTGCSPNTVRRELGVLGEALLAFHDGKVRGVTCRHLQVDEGWSYVYAKKEWKINRKNVKRPAPPDTGHFYTWVGIDADTKLLIGWRVGDRSHDSAIPFLLDLRSRILNRPLISSDAYEAYPDAVQQSFGADADHVLLKKTIQTWKDFQNRDKTSKYLGAIKIPLNQTKVDLELAGTAHVERWMGTLRTFVSRFNRETYKFSKRLSNHIHHQAIFAVYYNFTKKHGGFKGAERHFTPAMKAGLTDRIWSYDDLLDHVDEYYRTKAQKPTLQAVAPTPYTPLAVGETSDRPYFVSYSAQKRVAKVHKATCRNCQHGVGRKSSGGPRMNQWFAFQTEQGARRCAETLAPLQHGVCSICIVGHYEGVRTNMRTL
jgi:IS1 family transposase